MPAGPLDAQTKALGSLDQRKTPILPDDLLIEVIVHVLDSLIPWERQRFALCTLSLTSKGLRGVVEGLDGKRMAVGGSKSLLCFDKKRAASATRVTVQVNFEFRNHQGEPVDEWTAGATLRLWNLSRMPQGSIVDARALRLLGHFKAVKHLSFTSCAMRELVDSEAIMEEMDPGYAIAMAFLRLPFLKQLTTLHWDTGFYIIPDILWLLCSECSNLIELTLDQFSHMFVSGPAGEYMEPPRCSRSLKVLNTGSAGDSAMESVLWHAAPGSCLVRAWGWQSIVCDLQRRGKEGIERYPAALAPHSIRLDWLPVSTQLESPHSWPNVLTLEVERYVLLDETTWWSYFPALKSLTLGIEGFTTPPPGNKSGETRVMLLKAVRTSPRGLSLVKQATGWAVAEKRDLEKACKEAGVSLTWFVDWNAIDHL